MKFEPTYNEDGFYSRRNKFYLSISDSFYTTCRNNRFFVGPMTVKKLVRIQIDQLTVRNLQEKLTFSIKTKKLHVCGSINH